MDEILRDLRLCRLKMASPGLLTLPDSVTPLAPEAPPDNDARLPKPPTPGRLATAAGKPSAATPAPAGGAKTAADGEIGSLLMDRVVRPRVRAELAKPVAWQPPVAAVEAGPVASHNRKALFSGVGDWFKNVYMKKYKPYLPKIQTEAVDGYFLKRPVGTPPRGTPMAMAPKGPPSLALRGMMAGYRRPKS